MIRWLSHLHITFPLLKTGPEGSGHMWHHEISWDAWNFLPGHCSTWRFMQLTGIPGHLNCFFHIILVVDLRHPASWEVDLFASQISWYPELGTLNSHNHGFSEKWGLSPNHLVTFQKLLRLIFYVDEPTHDGSCLIKEFFLAKKKHRNLLRKISFKPWTMLWTASPPCQCPGFGRETVGKVNFERCGSNC